MQFPSPVLVVWLRQLQGYARSQAEAWAEPAAWCHPPSVAILPRGIRIWNGDLRDNLEGAEHMFSRAWEAEGIKEASEEPRTIADKQEKPPSPVGRLIALQMGGDLLAAAQRAYFARHGDFVGNQLLAAQRYQGVSQDHGVIIGGWLEHLISVFLRSTP